MQHARYQGIEISTYLRDKLVESRHGNVVVTIDGERHKVHCGTQFIHLPPGQHTVSVHAPIMWRKGQDAIEVDVQPDRVRRLRWDSPSFAWAHGRLTAGGSV